MQFAFDEFVLDTSAFELAYRGSCRPLQKRPLDVLTYLVMHRDRVVTKTELLSEVWGGVRVTENAVVQAVANIREALGTCGPHAIRNVRGRGYRFTLPVVAIDEARSSRAPEDPVTLRIPACSGEPLGTFRALLDAYAAARPCTTVGGVPLHARLARANGRDEIVALVLALFENPAETPAVLIVDHLERADLDSLLLFAAITARPPASLAIRGTCAWAALPRESPVAPLLRFGMAGTPGFAA